MKQPVLGEQMERNQSHSPIHFHYAIFPFFYCANSLMSLISINDGQWRYVTIDRRDHQLVCKSIDDCTRVVFRRAILRRPQWGSFHVTKARSRHGYEVTYWLTHPLTPAPFAPNHWWRTDESAGPLFSLNLDSLPNDRKQNHDNDTHYTT